MCLALSTGTLLSSSPMSPPVPGIGTSPEPAHSYGINKLPVSSPSRGPFSIPSSSHFFTCLFSFSSSHISQACLELDVKPIMTLNLFSFCLHYLSPGITSMCHHTQFIWCQDLMNTRQAFYQPYYIPRLRIFNLDMVA